MAGTINFFTEDITFDLKQKRKVRAWIQEVISKSKCTHNDLNIVFCSDAFLLEINTNFLHHDYYTDIITFSDSSQKQLIAGDILISIERVRENAGQLKIPFVDELHRVMIHGVLHLIGYKDKSKADKVVMRKMEDKMLRIRLF